MLIIFDYIQIRKFIKSIKNTYEIIKFFILGNHINKNYKYFLSNFLFLYYFFNFYSFLYPFKFRSQLYIIINPPFPQSLSQFSNKNFNHLIITVSNQFIIFSQVINQYFLHIIILFLVWPLLYQVQVHLKVMHLNQLHLFNLFVHLLNYQIFFMIYFDCGQFLVFKRHMHFPFFVYLQYINYIYKNNIQQKLMKSCKQILHNSENNKMCHKFLYACLLIIIQNYILIIINKYIIVALLQFKQFVRNQQKNKHLFGLICLFYQSHLYCISILNYISSNAQLFKIQYIYKYSFSESFFLIKLLKHIKTSQTYYQHVIIKYIYMNLNLNSNLIGISLVSPNMSTIYSNKALASKKSSYNNSFFIDDKKTKRKNVQLDICDSQHNQALYQLNKRSVKTSINNHNKSSLHERQIYEIINPIQNINQNYLMIKEDIMSRLLKRAEMIGEREQIQQICEKQFNGIMQSNVKEIELQIKLRYASDKLIKYNAQKTKLIQKMASIENEKHQIQEMEYLFQNQLKQFQSQQNQKYSINQNKLIEFSQKNNIFKILIQFLTQYRQSNLLQRQQIRLQFLKFIKTVLPINKFVQLEKLIEQLRGIFNKIYKEYQQKSERIKTCYNESRNRKIQIMNKLTQFQRECLQIKVNQQIEKGEIQKIKKQGEFYQNENKKMINMRVDQVFNQYLINQKKSFEVIQSKYGKQVKQKLQQQQKHKFSKIIKIQFQQNLHKYHNRIKRLRHLTNLIQYYTKEIQNNLIPLLNSNNKFTKKIPFNPNKENSKDYRNSLIELQQQKIDFEDNNLPIQLKREVLYEFIKRNDMRKRSLEKKRGKNYHRLSVDDKSDRLSKQSLYKIKKKQSVYTQQNQSQSNEIRFTDPGNYQNYIVNIIASNKQQEFSIFQYINNLFMQVSIQKKPYISTPIYNIQTSLALLGYSSRLLSLSLQFNLEFRMGKQPNTKHIMKGGKVDQIIQLQRIKRLQKIKSGSSFSICLDKGVIDVVFKIQSEYLAWFNGLNYLLKNRGVVNKLKGKIYFSNF